MTFTKKIFENQNKTLLWWNYRFSRWKMSKTGSDYTYWAVISVDSACKEDENYYPQAFLKERKYIEKEVIRYITKNIETISYFSRLSLLPETIQCCLQN